MERKKVSWTFLPANIRPKKNGPEYELSTEDEKPQARVRIMRKHIYFLTRLVYR